MSQRRALHNAARQRLFIFCMAMVFFGSLSFAAEPAENGASGADDPSAHDEPLPKPTVFVPAPPTIPLPPPILPSFYNTPIGLDQVYAGRSLSHVFSVCGDGVYDPGEECDDGNRDSEDGCSDLCRLEDPLSCGNGKVGPGERCDDGNLADGDGCSATCQSEGLCGDGITDPGEECDDGNKSSEDGCSRLCYLEEKAQENSEREKPVDLVLEDPAEEEDPEESEEDIIPEEKEVIEREIDGEKTYVTYVTGRAATTKSGCTASCTMEVTKDAQGRIISVIELFGERRMDPGSTYYDPVYGDISCETGQSVNVESASQNAAEDPGSFESVTITSCQI